MPPHPETDTGREDLPRRIAHRLNAVLEKWLPEQRLFLKSDSSTRFVRLRPTQQAVALGGVALVFGWSIVATSILVIDGISSGNAQGQARQAQAAFEQRLDTLSAERDSRAAEAAAAQSRFNVALAQVSQMQSALLASEERRRELEKGLGVVQSTLRQAMDDRDTARDQAAVLSAQVNGDADAPTTAAARVEELAATLDVVTAALGEVTRSREGALAEAQTARLAAAALEAEKSDILERQDEIFAKLEDAVTISVQPLDKMFKSVGMNPDDLLRTIRRGYSGQGGPLTPLSHSSKGNADITTSESRANAIIEQLDRMNSYRIAVDTVPLALPVAGSFRYTSGFGRRWGRAHEGIDMAGPVGTPIVAPANGTVSFAGWQSGYGNLIKITHANGIETRYGHLSKIRVRVGQSVSRGERIGDMGNTGRSTGPHLHYEVRVGGTAVNPMTFIKAAQNVF
ncbi:DUF5930 domain-containing protein [Paracoccus sp. p4-l81]|uniref:DUF5930 domain-containing protein n=1 Tax=unclassified Paracoccus (in: a-proteobacteria) TaxID=2688777 RepID=UPI0035BA36D9